MCACMHAFMCAYVHTFLHVCLNAFLDDCFHAFLCVCVLNLTTCDCSNNKTNLRLCFKYVILFLRKYKYWNKIINLFFTNSFSCPAEIHFYCLENNFFIITTFNFFHFFHYKNSFPPALSK